MEIEPVISITDLWVSEDPKAWGTALDRYWEFVRGENLDLEKSLRFNWRKVGGSKRQRTLLG
ncbi:MAG: hypothetical protein E5W82_25140 [Mesorhizobium sp.]|nr:MAG: hypothetical protein E5W82_25140 [Mesorhizobium sp.]TJW42560.1 MAG: hypothetical protein E5W83_20785 [Mesorhizobium sp.]